MANNQFINLEELSKTTQALLSKINEQSNLKVNKTNIISTFSEGTKIAEIENVNIYAPNPDLSDYPTYEELSIVAHTGDYTDLQNIPNLTTIATSGSFNDLLNKPIIPILKMNNSGTNQVTLTSLNNSFSLTELFYLTNGATANLLFYLPSNITFSTSSITAKNGDTSYNLYIYDQNGTSISNSTTFSPGIYAGELIQDGIYRFKIYNNIQVLNSKNAITVNNHSVGTDVPANAIFTDTIYDDTAISSRITTLENAGYITSYTETDPTVPSWAKASTKPTYTASEVGAVPVSASGISSASYIYNTNNSIELTQGDSGGNGSSSFTMQGSIITLTSTKDLGNAIIKLKTNNVENIVLSEGQTTITGVVTPTSNTMAANKKYVDDSIAAIDLSSYALAVNIPSAETDSNVENMLDGFNLDYTTTPGASVNTWSGGNY